MPKNPIVQLICEGEDVLPVRAASFSSSGNFLAIGTNSKILQILDSKKLDIKEENANLLIAKDFHQGPIYCLDISNDEKMIVTGSMDKTCKILRLSHEPQNSRIKITQVLNYIGHAGMIRSVKFNKAST